MKQVRRSLFLLAVCASPLQAENWGGLAIIGRLFLMLIATLPIPFVLLYSRLVATENRSRPLLALALIGAVVTIAAPMWVGIKGWSTLPWIAIWFGIGFVSFQKTKTRHPIWLGAALTLVSFMSAYLLTIVIYG
jgi:hypothetical protein